jgi:hypothetical protein
MKKQTKTKVWVKPEVKRVGTMKDVAGPNNVGGQGFMS